MPRDSRKIYDRLRNRVGNRNRKRGESTRIDFSPETFSEWYSQQPKVCHYCGIPEDKIESFYWEQRQTRRPRTRCYLEIERKDPSGDYSKKNCVLACFSCNNAKSDIFSYDEFKEVGKTINKIVKKGS